MYELVYEKLVQSQTIPQKLDKGQKGHIYTVKT